jgi:SNF2 family DNA or RNA helicase
MPSTVGVLQGGYNQVLKWFLVLTILIRTPIINSLVDVYGYLRFLKIRPWHDFQQFQSHIGSREKKNRKSVEASILFSLLKQQLAALAVSRLQAVITTFLLRRMKDSLLDGKRLIELPGKTVSLIRLEFSAEEREIYTMVRPSPFKAYLKPSNPIAH